MPRFLRILHSSQSNLDLALHALGAGGLRSFLDQP